MAIIRWRPRREWDPFESFTGLPDLVERFFGDFHHHHGWPIGEWTGHWHPAIDAYRENGNLITKVELPGLTEKDVDVSMVENTLVIKGEKKREKEVKREDFYRIERAEGAFERRITLPSDVDGEKVKAKMKNGVLTVTIPVKEEVKPKEIKVEAN